MSTQRRRVQSEPCCAIVGCLGTPDQTIIGDESSDIHCCRRKSMGLRTTGKNILGRAPAAGNCTQTPPTLLSFYRRGPRCSCNAPETTAHRRQQKPDCRAAAILPDDWQWMFAVVVTDSNVVPPLAPHSPSTDSLCSRHLGRTTIN